MVPIATSHHLSRLGGYNSDTIATKRRHTDPAQDDTNPNRAEQSKPSTRCQSKPAPTKRHGTRSHAKTAQTQHSPDDALPPLPIDNPPTLHFGKAAFHSTSRHKNLNLPTHNSKTAFNTGIARMAKTVPTHSLNFTTAQQQTNSLWIPNLPPQPHAHPSTIFLKRAPPS